MSKPSSGKKKEEGQKAMGDRHPGKGKGVNGLER